MPYRIATSLLLWQHGVTAFQTTPLQRYNRFPSPSSLNTATPLETIPSLESILDDGHGHINSNLAQAIYEWEVAHNHPNSKSFSTRDGLRLVDELAREILSSLASNGDDDDSSNNANNADDDEGGISYNDLVQEGMIALLRAMSTYDNYKSHQHHNDQSSSASSSPSSFETYARQSIHSSLLHFLAHSSRPIRLPLSLTTKLQRANAAADKLRQSHQKEPTLIQVAKAVNMKPEQLALYRKLYKSMVARTNTFVSMEDGMEVYDPSLAGVGVGTKLHARSDSENIDKGKRGDVAQSISQGGETSSSNNDNDNNISISDDWTTNPPERTVAPLKDILTDTEEINNPLSYTHHYLLNEELNAFLLQTLTAIELQVIQLRFGLVDSKYGGKGWTANEIGERMGMKREEVGLVASGALEKLRKAAAVVGTGIGIGEEYDHDGYVEVSL